MKVNFILKGKNDPTNIVCRVTPKRGYDFTCTTGIWVNRSDWSESKQQAKQRANNTNADLINSKLKGLEKTIVDTWNLDNLEQKAITKNWLKDVVLQYFGKAPSNLRHKKYYADWVQLFLKTAHTRVFNGKTVSKATVVKYQSTFSKLKAFQEHTQLELTFREIDLKFYQSFVNYLSDIQKLSNNSIGSHIKNIKLWCRCIELEGYPINQQYKHPQFKKPTNQTNDIYLTDDEINTIFNFDFTHSTRLDRTRDLFVVGARTGLRVSDFMRISSINISNDNIYITTQKTKTSVVVPMHHQVKAIFLKYGNKLPDTISPQKFNKYIKEVCKDVGIDSVVEGARLDPITKRKTQGLHPKFELVTSHTCRRSFATISYKQGVPTKVIMAITGHKTETQFQKYIKMSGEEYAEILNDFWSKEQPQNTSSTHLKKVN